MCKYSSWQLFSTKRSTPGASIEASGGRRLPTWDARQGSGCQGEGLYLYFTNSADRLYLIRAIRLMADSLPTESLYR